MNLMKWFRKNNKKVMAIVVIVIMFGFIAGPFMRYLGRIRTGWHRSVAHFGDNRKITVDDLRLARLELDILRSLRADALLKSQDLRGVLLSELLFAERSTAPAIISHIKRIIRENGYQISDKQISDIYNHSMPADYYWLLLESEAQKAGVRVETEEVGRLLGRMIPRLFDGISYSQVIMTLITKQGVTEQQILTTFGKLLAVLQYSHMICSGEDVTTSQIMHVASWENETMDVEFVKFDSAVFAETQDQPDEQAISAQFNKYKKYFVGDISGENPYGFGYKLADRVQLEYLTVKLDDIMSIVNPPTSQEKEEYYQRNIQQFTKSIPLDPNDPNSLSTEQTKRYAEVESFISEGLLQDKINSKADGILQEAKTLTEAGLESIDTEKLTSEQYRQMARDYTDVAEQLSKKHKINIYAGQTGLLNAVDIQTDRNLGTLLLKGPGYNPVGLAQVVFSIDELGTTSLRAFDVPKPRMYENIGPLRDLFGRMMVLVRIVKAQPASEPESLEQVFSTRTFVLDPNQSQQGEDVYSVREKVVEDLKKLAALDVTKSKAEEFIKMAGKDGWDNAIDNFNELYGVQYKKDPNDPNAFRLINHTDLQRLSSTAFLTFAEQNAANPAVEFMINEFRKQTRFIDRLYSLVQQGSNTVDTLPMVMEFKPDMSFYIIKNISVNYIDQAEYEGFKALRLYKEDFMRTQSMAAVHFNPENILKRTKFRLLGNDKQAKDANKPAEAEEAM